MRETPTISNMAYTSTTNTVDDFLGRGMAGAAVGGAAQALLHFPVRHHQQQEQDMGTRIVKVFVADNDESLPLEHRVLFQGEEKLTDLTDQELFFELPVQELLTKHNAIRAKTRDKDQSTQFGRDVMLEPVKVRDLKMVIVNVASFG